MTSAEKIRVIRQLTGWCLEEGLAVEHRANDPYEAYRARGVMRDGRRFGAPPKPYEPPAAPAGKINVTDPDSRNLKTPRGYMQGYNAQAATNENQIVLAAEITIDSPDFGHLEPIVDAAEAELAKAGVTDSAELVLADAGYIAKAVASLPTPGGLNLDGR